MIKAVPSIRAQTMTAAITQFGPVSSGVVAARRMCEA
jgi:hypothetical protein